ncbi:hypothetical protein AK812_SmicGene11472 [Symbiodinium microadriaticum]|uniref:Isopenicillin N synthase-like Fe(2+) 2OG dioxygenase domain-containing protein n=1 Tax=Symbiodinium microadriaticum TaxID=2951 RepID=A0A1Q9ED34_SYMMI|nr:hypothetical protein AK812_SmicGene11472 [Symbiodinium microadriaticum]
MQVRYLLVKAPDDAIVTPQGVCAGLIPPAAVRWSHSVPHQDASWVTLLVESSSGLLIKPNRLDSWQKVSFARPGHLLVLVGAALALASQGHYPAPCHAVQVPSSFRLSWAWISPAHSCFYNPTYQMHLSQCGMAAVHWRHGRWQLVPFKVALRDHSLASSRQRRHLGENQGHSEYAHARRQCPHPVVSILTTRLEDRDMVSDLAFANFIFCCPVPFITQQRVASVFVRLKTTTQMGFPVSFG